MGGKWASLIRNRNLRNERSSFFPSSGFFCLFLLRRRNRRIKPPSRHSIGDNVFSPSVFLPSAKIQLPPRGSLLYGYLKKRLFQASPWGEAPPQAVVRCRLAEQLFPFVLHRQETCPYCEAGKLTAKVTAVLSGKKTPCGAFIPDAQ